MESQAIKKMEKSEILRALEVAYNATFTQEYSHFNGSDLQAEAFGRILNELVFGVSNRSSYAFSVKNEGGSWATFICPCLPGGYIPATKEMRVGNKITVLLHWGMDYKFLDDLSSWGHEKCPYRIDDVDYSVVEKFTKEEESNYWFLYDTIVEYKETEKWSVDYVKSSYE